MEKLSIILGKTVQQISKIKGGGSALPGLVIEKTNPHFLQHTLNQLPKGVVVVSGTNGKTTTTKIVSELLTGQGLKVFTNKSGSNFVRGVISAILEDIKLNGQFDYDIAVLELDEAHAVKFTEEAKVDYSLLLNIQADQLDRFGTPEKVANCLRTLAARTNIALVTNREDLKLRDFNKDKAHYFGLSNELREQFSANSKVSGVDANEQNLPALVTLEKINDNHAVYQIEDKNFDCKLNLKGLYNAYNAAGALALCKIILPEADNAKLISDLANIESAYGRGESFKINDADVELLLVKNPSAFQLTLASFTDDKHDYMIALNNKVADGVDSSWLWDVDFSAINQIKMLSGSRAKDIALRLKYDEVKVANLDLELQRALNKFLYANKKPKYIFASYTAMLEIRKILSGSSIL